MESCHRYDEPHIINEKRHNFNPLSLYLMLKYPRLDIHKRSPKDPQFNALHYSDESSIVYNLHSTLISYALCFVAPLARILLPKTTSKIIIQTDEQVKICLGT